MTEQLYTRVIGALMALPWAILPQKLVVIQELMKLRASGQKLTPEDVQAAMDMQAAVAARRAPGAAGVAVIPLLGTIVPRGNMLLESSGATSVQVTAARFREALRDPDIGSIVLDVDSPGGQVGGIEELGREIYEARGQKPIIASVNGLAASAAYWIASAADEVVVTPSGMAGSIGVLMVHQDVSAMLEREGVRMSMVSAGKYKTEGNAFEPLTDEARADWQALVDDYYDLFTKAVARNRGVKVAEVRNGFGEGRVVTAAQAVSLGMADRVGTFGEVVQRLASGRGRSAHRLGADADWDFRQRRWRLAGDAGVSVDTAVAGSVEPGVD